MLHARVISIAAAIAALAAYALLMPQHALG